MEISYIFSKESFPYISGNQHPEKKNSLYFRKRNFLIFQETELSYISGGTPKALKIKISDISLKKVINKFL